MYPLAWRGYPVEGEGTAPSSGCGGYGAFRHGGESEPLVSWVGCGRRGANDEGS